MSKPIACLIVDDEAMARDIIESHLKKIEGVDVVGQCKNAIEAFNFIRKDKVDLIFLDINMPEVSGIAFAKSINSNIKIIFTTAYRDYAVEGFDLQAVDYLLKPISLERLSKAISRYTEVYKSTDVTEKTEIDVNDFIFVRSERRMVKINFDTIIYVESYSDYIKIHATNGVTVTRETISSIEAKLPKPQFIRIHRSYIVSLNSIESFTSECVSINSTNLTISRSYKTEVLQILENF